MHFFRFRFGRAVLLITWVFVTTASGVSAKDASQRDLQIAETILLYQRNNGGWPKNFDRDGNLSKEDRNRILSEKDLHDSTFDNGATHSEMKHLAQVYQATGDDRRVPLLACPRPSGNSIRWLRRSRVV